MRRPALLLLVAALAAGCGGGAKQAAVRLRGTPLDAMRAPDFTLHDDRGRVAGLSSLRGDYVLVTFLYTHCPDVCPLIAANLGVVLRQLPVGQANVRALAISVDPTGDTPAAVRRFVAVHRLPSTFRFLIGTRAELASVWRKYHIAAGKGPENTVNHSAYTVLIDPEGNERVLYDAQVQPQDVLHDLRALSS